MGDINERLENKLTTGLADIVKREVRSGLQNSPHLASPPAATNHINARDKIQVKLMKI